MIHESWIPIFKEASEELKMNFLKTPVDSLYPAEEDFFEVFKYPVDNYDVAILGTSINYSVSTGRLFGVHRQAKHIPNTLIEIMRELDRDFNPGYLEEDGKPTKLSNFRYFFDVSLEEWAEQGVLLLNTNMSTEQGSIRSHSKDWEEFIKVLVQKLEERRPRMVWGLLGPEAAKFKDPGNTMCVFAPGPALVEKGVNFVGSGFFTKINERLEFMANRTIEW